MNLISRRQFLGYMVGFIGVVTLGKIALGKAASAVSLEGQINGTADHSLLSKSPIIGKFTSDGQSTIPLENFQPAMVIDSGACIGCRRCMYACKAENNEPDSISPPWIQVFQLPDEVGLTGHPSQEDLLKGSTTNYTESAQDGFWYLAAQCNHCKNPPCVKVCPTGATFKSQDGYVLMDYQKCVGCRFCVVACPYNARRFNWVKPQLNEGIINPQVPVRPLGVVEKCTFCVHRTRDGRLPKCVDVCPVGARHFGNLLDPQSEVSKLLKAEKSFRLLEELNTGPHIYYITRGKTYSR